MALHARKPWEEKCKVGSCRAYEAEPGGGEREDGAESIGEDAEGREREGDTEGDAGAHIAPEEEDGGEDAKAEGEAHVESGSALGADDAEEIAGANVAEGESADDGTGGLATGVAALAESQRDVVLHCESTGA